MLTAEHAPRLQGLTITALPPPRCFGADEGCRQSSCSDSLSLWPMLCATDAAWRKGW